MAWIKSEVLLSVSIWVFSLVCSATADICSDGSFCDYYCCNDRYGEHCCYNVAFAWWFWFVWGFFILFVFLSCCAIIRRRQIRRQQQVIVVQQEYAPTGYGTVTNPQGPPTYVHPGYQPQGYSHPPPGPAPQYQPVESAQPIQQAQAYPENKPDQVPHNPNEKPPPYNPYTS
ncbi:WW domain binding protein 1-like [Asterias rubens]|uniref:WW domain binding protein 1-like n=1 Tax=Asterias rubens TaxID=7604 RepID=UPI001455D58C|nr:WW domain binding protein 1-like [Asterias rubens]